MKRIRQWWCGTRRGHEWEWNPVVYLRCVRCGHDLAYRSGRTVGL